MRINLIQDANLVKKLPLIVIISFFILILWLGYQVWNLSSSSERVANPGSLIVRQVRDISELTTAMFEMDTVVPVTDKAKVAVVDIESKLLYIAHGSVRVGIDLSELQADNVQVEKDTITITLPPLKVLDSKLDLEHSEVYSSDRGFLGWGPDVLDLQATAQREALKKVEEAACQNWLIKTASERVQKTIDHLLTQQGYGNIIVQTQPLAEGSCAR